MMGPSKVLRELGVAAALLASVATAAQNETCYWPDGSTADGFVQCKETSAGGFTFCCGVADTCTLEGYCVGVGIGQLYRGGCTDQTWTASQCPKLCTTNGVDNWNNFYTCTAGTASPDNYTCGDLGCGGDTFYFDPGSLFLPEGAAVAATATTTVTVTASPGGATSGTSPAANSALASSSANDCPSHNGTTIGVGVGLGAGLGLLVIAAFSGFLIERKKRKAAEETATTMQGADYNQKSSAYNRQMDYGEDYRGNKAPPPEPDPRVLHELGPSHN